MRLKMSTGKGVIEKLKSGEHVIIFDNIESLGLQEGDIIEYNIDESNNKKVSFKKVDRFVSEEELAENEMLQKIINVNVDNLEK